MTGRKSTKNGIATEQKYEYIFAIDGSALEHFRRKDALNVWYCCSCWAPCDQESETLLETEGQQLSIEREGIRQKKWREIMNIVRVHETAKYEMKIILEHTYDIVNDTTW